MLVRTRATTFKSDGGDCPDSMVCYNRHGRTIALTGEWQTYETDFCALAQEDWGGTPSVFDPTLILGVDFTIRSTSEFDISFDDLAFIERPATSPGTCKPVCPGDEVPLGVSPDPESTAIDPATGVVLHTFEQPTPDCGPLARRYLVYVPKALPSRSDAPVLIALPGTGSDAENLRDFMTHERFERLADRDGFIVVYGNAAPSSDTHAEWPNGGSWRTTAGSQIDDQAYLARVIADLQDRAVTTGTNPIYLVGHSNGGGMALSAAQATPTRYAGFAAIMPFAGVSPSLPDATFYSLKHIFLAYSDTDPTMPKGYSQVIGALGLSWAKAIGLSESDRAAPNSAALDDHVVEGSGYLGSDPVVLATRDSRAQQTTYRNASSGAAVRFVEFDHAGHFWPLPDPSDSPETLATYGLRNQDIDMSDAVWDFFNDAP
jgi:poly(3-hydroxybutyrate) depolymerase